jgi:NAD-dependent SIR2 family protein deacetylase
VLTTNVDHCFQKAGIDKTRLFYTQGDYGLWQCSTPCHRRTYDNEETVKKMVELQKDMRVPSELVPRCPQCGGSMTMNLRSDDTFVEDLGWNEAASRYVNWVQAHEGKKLLLLELGVGSNTPGIIKYPFWRITAQNPNATYVCLNFGEAECPKQIEDRAILVNADIADVIEAMR